MTHDEAVQIAKGAVVLSMLPMDSNERAVMRIASLLMIAYNRGCRDTRMAIEDVIEEANKPPSRKVYGVALTGMSPGHDRERTLWGVFGVPEEVALEQQQYWEYHLAVPARVVSADRTYYQYGRPVPLPPDWAPPTSAPNWESDERT